MSGIDTKRVFELIMEHKLWDSVKDKVLALVRLSPSDAVDMLVDNIESVGVGSVVSQLQKEREYQHQYLAQLFKRRRDEYNTEVCRK